MALSDHVPSCDTGSTLQSVYQLGSCGSGPWLSGHVIFGMPDTSMHTEFIPVLIWLQIFVVIEVLSL